MIAALYARKSTTRYLRVLLGPLGLLVLTTSASAESAWVLWDETWLTSAKSGRDGPKRFEVIAGFGTVRECEAARVAFLVQYGTGPTVPIVTKPMTDQDMKGALNNLRPFCLPDTVDPRGPKGK
jgi:hypothetical protein